MATKTAAAKKKAIKQTLVIVESPAKAKTIEKYLGKGFVVKASMGHLIDLPKSRMAINVDEGFTPEYITVRGRAKLLKELQSDAKKSKEVLLASDNDREGRPSPGIFGTRSIRNAPFPSIASSSTRLLPRPSRTRFNIRSR